MSISTFSAQPLASRVFGEFSRFRLVTGSTRHGTVEFFLYDAESVCADGLAEIVAQSDTLEGALSRVSPQDREQFLSARPTKKGQKAINLSQTPVKVCSFNQERGVLVECLTTAQRWYADPNKLVLAS